MARFPFSRAWARGIDAGALGALRRRLQGDGRRRFHQLTNERCADGKRPKGGTARESVGRSSSGSAAGARGGAGQTAWGRDGGAHSSSGVGSEPTPSRSLLFRGLAAYERLNETHSTATKVGTSVVILLFGDVAANDRASCPSLPPLTISLCQREEREMRVLESVARTSTRRLDECAGR